MATFFCGLDPSKTLTDNNGFSSMNAFQDYGYNFVTQFIKYPTIFHETFKKTKSPLNSTSLDLNRYIIGRLSLDLKCKKLLHNSELEESLTHELQYAQYLGISTVLIPIYNHNYIEFAHILCQLLNNQLSHVQVVIELPILDEDLLSNGEMEDSLIQIDDHLWQMWVNFYNLCSGYQNRIRLALRITADLPSDPKIIERWLCEPLKYVILPTDLFISNKKGFPILSKPHQTLINDIFKINAQLIISGASQYSDKSLKVYHEYLEHLWDTYQKSETKPKVTSGYEDVLQYPLQPLKDNLDSYTYEVFEQDTTKYTYYEDAIYHCLLDTASNQTQDPSSKIILMVLGAGRGPLVTAALSAGHRSQRKLQVFAVEKNPFSVLTLHQKNSEIWGNQVTIVEGDMRNWKPPNHVGGGTEGDDNLGFADIIVSELLGSFGDNELSPECLYGAEVYLKKGGISIPQNYTSWIAPLMSPKLYAEVSNFERNSGGAMLQPKMGECSLKSSCYEMPFVVHLTKGMEISPPRPLFTFTHPTGTTADHHEPSHRYHRYAQIAFDASPVDTICHGFIGYFETTLYKHVKLSIVPANHTENMYSWFPIYFPIKEPMTISKGTAVTLSMWRCCDKLAVWYEWAITGPKCSELHNVNGRSYSISLL